MSWGDEQTFLHCKEDFCWKSYSCRHKTRTVKSEGQGELIEKAFLVPFPTPPPPPSIVKQAHTEGKKTRIEIFFTLSLPA